MKTLTNSTFKSASASIGLHVLFIFLGSWAFYSSSMESLELTGSKGGGSRSISLDGINFVGKKRGASHSINQTSKSHQKVFSRTHSAPDLNPTTGIHTASSSAPTGTQEEATGNLIGSGNGSGIRTGEGVGKGDFDQGILFGQIKNYFESRLGSTLNIRENQLIKIKVTLNPEGEILDAVIVHGKLDMSVLRRVISVAKNIPIKHYWKTSSYPQELIIPLFLTPS